MGSLFCHSCGKENRFEDKIFRKDTCIQCSQDLHCCLNCEFYDIDYNNSCRESAADIVTIKEEANFCEYFKPICEKGASPPDKRKKGLADFDKLFKK